MISWLKALGMCQSMFCSIPCPWHGWDESVRDRMLLCLPFVGLEIGALWYLTALAVSLLKLPALLSAAAVCAAPWLLTGFMHLDGFMDVTDAVRSWRSAERRREILKDSHVGSFSVIAFGLVLMTQFAACACIADTALYRVLFLIPVVSRCLSILAIRQLKPMSTSQYARRDGSAGGSILLLAVLSCAFLAAGLLSIRFLAVLAGQAAAFGLSLRRAYRSLEGMNGDISGYCITISELTALVLTATIG